MNFSRSSFLLPSELETVNCDGIIGSLELCEAFGRALIELLPLMGDVSVDAIADLLWRSMGELEVFVATEIVAVTVDFAVVEAAIIFLAIGEVAVVVVVVVVVMAEVVTVFTVTGPVETVVMAVIGAVPIAVVVVTDTIGTEVTLEVVEDRVTVDWAEVDNWPEEIIELIEIIEE